MELNLEWYRVFYWTAQLGSVTNAAKQLHITQPAVSHTLKQLEASLGNPLFFRTPKGVKLTAEGTVLFRYIEQAMGLVQAGEKKIAEMSQLHYGEVTIGASDTLCKLYLLPFLEQFHLQYPQIKISVNNRTTPETITLLKSGTIDFGIVHMPINERDLVVVPSMDLQDILVGGPQYAHLLEKPMSFEELQHYPLLLLEQGGSTRAYLDQYAVSQGILLKPEFELGSVDLLIKFAQSGFGLTFVGRQYIQEELEAGKLVEIPLVSAIPPRQVGIAMLQDVPLSTAARALLEFILPKQRNR